MSIFGKDMPEVGTEQIITKFLWFPKTIDGITHWLTTRTYKRKLELCFDDRHIMWEPQWNDIEWLDDIIPANPMVA